MEKRKLLSLFLALTMLFMSIPVELFAEGEAVETVTVVEEAPVEVKEEAPAPAAEPVVEVKEEAPAPAAEPVEEVKEEIPAPAAEPVVEGKEEAPAPAEEPAVEEQPAEEPAAEPAAEEQPVEEPAAEPAVEEQPAEEPAAEPAVEEQPAEEPVAEPVVEEVPAEEPVAEEPAETVEEAFKAGLAKLSAGDVFADKKLQKVFGKLDAEAVVYAAERVSGEGELANDDVIRVAANIEGEIKSAYVKNARLAYLDEEAVATYLEDQHDNGVAYNGVKLDPVAFTPAEAEEDNAPAELVEEAEPVETTDVPAEEPATEVAEPVDEQEETAVIVPAEESAPEATEEQVEETEPDLESEAEVPSEEVEHVEETSEEAVLYYATVKLATQKSINLRSTASSADKAKISETAAKGEKVAVLSESGDWAYIRSAEGEGYIMLKFLVKLEEETAVDTDDAESSEANAETALELVGVDSVVEVERELLQTDANSNELDEVDENVQLTDEVIELETILAGSGINITKQPDPIEAAIGDSVTASVEATGEGLTYQWYYKAATGTKYSAWKNRTTAEITFTVIKSFIGMSIYCEVTDANGTTVNSETVTITETSEIEITKQPDPIEAAIGDSVTASVEAAGEGLTYQWYYKAATGTNYAAWKNRTTAEITFTVIKSFIGMSIYCEVTDANGKTVNSEAVTITEALTSEIEITKQPDPIEATVGDSVTASVEATGEGLTYQWYYKAATGTKYAAWKNRTTAEITFTVSKSFIGMSIYCEVTNANGKTLNSETVTITEAPTSEIEITKQPDPIEAAVGDSVTASVEATGEGLTYQWYYKAATGTNYAAWKNRTTAEITFTVSKSFIGMSIYCEVTDAYGKTVNSEAVTITEAPTSEIEITKQPDPIEAAVGDSVTASVEATGEGLTYQWYYKAANGTNYAAWKNRTTAEITFTVSKSFIGMSIYCEVTDAYGKTVNSEAVTITEIMSENGVVYARLDDGTLEVQSYNGTASALTIPGTFNGMTVTKIGDDAFAGNTNLTSIDLPDSITIIGKRAFKGCSNLSEMK